MKEINQDNVLELFESETENLREIVAREEHTFYEYAEMCSSLSDLAEISMHFEENELSAEHIEMLNEIKSLLDKSAALFHKCYYMP
jgi:hypothetical protein